MLERQPEFLSFFTLIYQPISCFKLTHSFNFFNCINRECHKIINFVFSQLNERFADDSRACHLATAFEVIATVGTNLVTPIPSLSVVMMPWN